MNPDSTENISEGQDNVDRSSDSLIRPVPQGNLEVRRHHTKK